MQLERLKFSFGAAQIDLTWACLVLSLTWRQLERLKSHLGCLILTWNGSDLTWTRFSVSLGGKAVGATQISLGLPNSRLEWLGSHLGLLSSQRTSRCSWSILNLTWAVFSLGVAQISLGLLGSARI